MPKENRTEQLTIKLSPSELEALKKSAEADHRTPSDWARLAMLETMKDKLHLEEPHAGKV